MSASPANSQRSPSEASPTNANQSRGAGQSTRGHKRRQQSRGGADDHQDNETDGDEDGTFLHPPLSQGSRDANRETIHRSDVSLGISMDGQDKKDFLRVIMNVKVCFLHLSQRSITVTYVTNIPSSTLNQIQLGKQKYQEV